jgi:hypothetical protein
MLQVMVRNGVKPWWALLVAIHRTPDVWRESETMGNQRTPNSLITVFGVCNGRLLRLAWSVSP